MLRVRLMGPVFDFKRRSSEASLGSVLHQSLKEAPRSSLPHLDAWLRSGPIARWDLGLLQQKELEHKLSRFVVQKSSDAFIEGRSLLEWAILKNSPFPSADQIQARGVYDFKNLLLQLKKYIAGASSSFRNGPIYTARDKCGQFVEYPPACAIDTQLHWIFRRWSDIQGVNSGFASLFLFAALLNLHPFCDGNGRVARLAFHWSMGLTGPGSAFLPVYELAAFSRGGLLIRLRQAQYHGNWFPLLDFFCCSSNRLLWSGEPTSTAGSS